MVKTHRRGWLDSASKLIQDLSLIRAFEVLLSTDSQPQNTELGLL